MRKKWRVTAEVNMDASRHKTVEVCTNLERKAKKLAEQELKKQGYFFVIIQSCKVCEEGA